MIPSYVHQNPLRPEPPKRMKAEADNNEMSHRVTRNTFPWFLSANVQTNRKPLDPKLLCVQLGLCRLLHACKQPLQGGLSLG